MMHASPPQSAVVRRVCDAFEVPGASWACPKPPAVISASTKWTQPVVPHEMVLVFTGILMEQTRNGLGRCPTWHLQRINTATGWHTLKFERWSGCTYTAIAPYDWRVL